MPFTCQLPRSLLVPVLGVPPERQLPLVAEDEAVSGVELRPSAFRGQVEEILGHVVLPATGWDPVMLKDETSSSALENVYEASSETPRLKRLRRLVSRA